MPRKKLAAAEQPVEHSAEALARLATAVAALATKFDTLAAKHDNLLATKLDVVLASQHELRRLIHKLTQPVEVSNLTEAARRLCRSTRWIKQLVARQVFTDGRAPGKRVAGADLIFFADEIDVYRSEGERGVKRLRDELGRLGSR